MNLSPQQASVIGLLCEGHGQKVIADKLKLSVSTVKNYVARIRSRLGVQTTIQAVAVFATLRRPQSPCPPKGGQRREGSKRRH